MYEYSKHAKDQMRDRSITKSEVEGCLNNYDIKCTDKKGNPIFRVKLENGRGIKVVVSEDNPKFIVTTADY